jgi:hypothetical protein
MAFFERCPEDKLPPEVKDVLELMRKRERVDRLDPAFYVMAAHPPLVKTFIEAFLNLIPVPNRFGTTQFIASMLIAHAKGCRPCFNASRDFLAKIGIDDAELTHMCEAPMALPLPERERRFVEFTLRVARDPGGLKPGDFREMERAGFKKDEILEMIGVAGYWALAATVSSALEAGLREE